MHDKNAYEDETHSGRRMKPRGKRRKPYTIEWRAVSKPGIQIWSSLTEWTVYNRYETESRRNQAYAVLVRKEANIAQRFGSFWWEYRKA